MTKEKAKVFYYTFSKFNFHFAINLVLSLMLLCAWKCWPRAFYWQPKIAFTYAVGACWLAWFWLYVLKHKMAVITDKSIKIDHCQPLNWKDVDYAEIRYVRYCLCKKPVIALVPKKKIKYQYNFLQKSLMKRGNGFPAFSIPLYEIVSASDAVEIYKIVAEKVGFK